MTHYIQPQATSPSAKRSAIYCRVSTSAQEAEGTSLETQQSHCQQFCRDLGFDLVDVFRDVYTGAKYRERPALSALRQLIRKREIDVLVSYALDRLSRNQAHLAILAEEAADHGVDLLFVTEDFENSAVGRFLRSAKAFAAEVEREKIAERSVRGKLARINAGKLLPGGRPLYGYKWRDPSRTAYDLDESTAPIVRRIFKDVLAGTPIRAVARQLSADQIATPKGGSAWAPTVVHGILKHPNYTGDASAWAWRQLAQAKTKAFDTENCLPLPPGTVPQIVDRASWEAVQMRLKLNKERSIRNARDPESALLRGGYACCGYCGKTMRVQNRKRQPPAYQCGAAYDLCRPCRMFSATVPTLDALVWEKVRSILLDPRIIAEQLEVVQGDDRYGAELRAIDRSIGELKRRQKNFVRELGLVDDAEIAAMLRAQLADLASHLRKLDHEREAVQGQAVAREKARARVGDIATWCSTVASNVDGLTFNEKRMALDALGIDVRVFAKDHDPRYLITAKVPLDAQVVSGTSRLSCRC